MAEWWSINLLKANFLHGSRNPVVEHFWRSAAVQLQTQNEGDIMIFHPAIIVGEGYRGCIGRVKPPLTVVTKYRMGNRPATAG